ncbi:MAG: DEAD/DEAH box helicase [Cyanophyceae cyanobacterium]
MEQVKDDPAANQLNLAEIFPFKLDDFQIRAIAALDAGKSVVVCAPTGSGKTLIGEYAIYRALAHQKRVFYTTPLKALSNQKFRDFQEKFGQRNVVGLITGDILVNPNAPIVVMTTEIFRNMLYETPIGEVGTSLEAVETVVLDECHYISDRQRGTVWEESIIYCPPSIQLVALSATIGNPEELADWIEQVRAEAAEPQRQCELIDSDVRPVPLRFYFSNRRGLFPLLNSKQKLNARLKPPKSKGNRRHLKENCPLIPQVIKQLRQEEMLPAIYIIFSRRGCDRAVNELYGVTLVSDQETQAIQILLLEFFLARNFDLQQQVIDYFAQENAALSQRLLRFFTDPAERPELVRYLHEYPDAKLALFEALAEGSEVARVDQLEPLTRGIAAHHAGLLPAWKELVEELFELGLVKVVFATATLAAGINMPARTTVISSLSKRTDAGHTMLTPSEFLQIAGRAGRRGMDEVGYVVTVQTPFEGAKEAAYLATAQAEPLKSWFTPSYGMVLNLLQKHDIDEVKDLLERSFAEYLVQRQLAPEQQAIASLSIELAKLDVELAPFNVAQLARYEKLKERLKEERRLLKILQQQAKATRRRSVTSLFPALSPGAVLYLEGKHVSAASPLAAVLVAKIPGSGQAPRLVCLGADNYWYVVMNADVIDIDEVIGQRPVVFQQALSDEQELRAAVPLSLPDLESVGLGQIARGSDDTAAVSRQLPDYALPTPPEVVEQQQRLDRVQAELDHHPLQQLAKPGTVVKRHKQRLSLQEQLHESQIKYQKHQSRRSYYWEEFLNLVEVLRWFGALDDFTPTPLGQAAAAIRGENELWLGLALASGALNDLEPPHLAAALCALITETPRPDTWTDYLPSPEVLEALGVRKSEPSPGVNLWEMRRQLNQIQNRYAVAMPVWLERHLSGVVEQWALGTEWNDLCEATSLDEGDIVRMLRRTVDLLWQVPQVPGLSSTLVNNAKAAIAAMKRFPV